MTSQSIESDVVGVVSRVAMRQYSRRGAFGLFGKAGLALVGLAVGIGLPRAAEACISPPPECYGFCSHCGSSCQVSPDCVPCNCPCPFGCQCYDCLQAHAVQGNGCACSCRCINPCSPC